MTSREIIKRNLEFTKPERIGLNFNRGRRADTVWSGASLPSYKEKRWTEGNFEYYDDIWGNIWVRINGYSAIEIND